MKTEIQQLDSKYIPQIAKLALQLNKDYKQEAIEKSLTEMFSFDNYYCFGLFVDGELIGISSAWLLIKLYSGKQIELDNLVIDQNHRSKGYGQLLIDHIEKWALEQGCISSELNAYVRNSKAHKLYHNLGYEIIGFHFEKKL